MIITRQRVRGVAAAVLAGLAVTAGAALPAAAAPADIDLEADVSLTIHKHAQPSSPFVPDGQQHDGSELVLPQETQPLAGVAFSVAEVVGVDLDDSTGWDTAAGLTAAQVLADPAAWPLSDDIGGRTDADGVLSLDRADGLDVGLYLVQETDPGEHRVAEAAVPFLVAVPQPLGDGGWNYDVHVYPKNVLEGPVDLRIDKAQIGEPVINPDGPSATVTWRLQVGNFGEASARSVELHDTYPAQLVADSVEIVEAPTQGAFDTASGLWSIGELDAGAVASVTIRARVTGDADAPSSVVNRATVTSPDDPYAGGEQDNNGLEADQDQFDAVTTQLPALNAGGGGNRVIRTDSNSAVTGITVASAAIAAGALALIAAARSRRERA